MTPDDKSLHHLCPVCKGVKRSFGKAECNFPLILDPEHDKLIPGHVWDEEFWVCAACLGQGTLTAHNARVLSGDYPPQPIFTEASFAKAIINQTPKFDDRILDE